MQSELRSVVLLRRRSAALLPLSWLALLMVTLLLPAPGMAQSAATTTISGTVYDPRGATGLPLPNILVYVSTTAPSALTQGVQCLTTASIPAEAIVYSFSDVNGNFTLSGVPVSDSYYLVIQAGKWRRIYANTVVGTAALTGQILSMPANHTEGDIPLIAISTGSVDGLECVFRDMGIDVGEVSDDVSDPTFTDRIHLYKGTASAGAAISHTAPQVTPSEKTLIDSGSLLNSYDIIMFPCQGSPQAKSPSELSNMLSFANSGGRIFTTHYSYDWLVNNSTYNSPFTSTSNGTTTGIANWNLTLSYPSPDPGIANVNTSFTDGATLAQWLYNASATYNGLQGEIQISTLRRDLTSVIAPTQPWLTMNSSSSTPDAVMQLTFNTPVGAPAAQQCGRVLFNEYHVMNLSTSGKYYPSECASSTKMSAQEMMLEYALFDLSAFVQPVVVPTLTLSFTPSPMVVNQGDTADQVTITATNTSSSVAIDPSAVLAVALPTGLTATALTDATGGWSCTLATLTCTRNTSIPSSSADAVVLTVSVPSYAASGLTSYTGQITASVSSPTFSSNVVGTDNVIFQQTPTINWPAPTSIIYGTPLSAIQLNATATVGATTIPGTFTYTPAAGAVLPVGNNPLAVSFTPTDGVHYTTASGATSITVLAATPTVTIVSNINPVFLSNPITFTAQVSSLGTTPTGTVVFYDGNVQLGTGTLNASGQTSFTATSLTTGHHAIVASYSGDATYNPAASAPLTQLVDDFTLTLSGSGMATVGLGQSVTFLLTVAPVVGTILPQAISFSVTGLPPETSASYSPTSLAAGSSAIVDYVQISMASAFAQARPAPSGMPRGLPLAFGILLLPGSRRIRRMARRWQGIVVVACVALALSAGFSACGFNFQPQSSTVTLTATSGNLSHAVSFKITAQ